MENDGFRTFPQPGDRAYVHAGTFRGFKGEILGIDEVNRSAQVRLVIYGRPVEIEVGSDEIQRD